MTNPTECYVCMENFQSTNFKCKTCSQSICIECIKKIALEYYHDNKMIIDYKCPICRDSHKYHYEDFHRDEIIKLAHYHIHEFRKFYYESDQIVKSLQNKLSFHNNNFYYDDYVKLKKRISQIDELCASSKNKTVKKTVLQSILSDSSTNS